VFEFVAADGANEKIREIEAEQVEQVNAHTIDEKRAH
jgi:hypothetical protein